MDEYISVPTAPNPASGVRYRDFKFTPMIIVDPNTFTVPGIVVPAFSVIPGGTTVVMSPGTTVEFDPGAELEVAGTLHAGALPEPGKDDPVRLIPTDGVDGRWSGIRLTGGTAELANCQLSGSENGIYVEKDSDLTLDSCILDDNANGITVCAPGGKYVIHGTTVSHTGKDGIVLVAARDVAIENCPIFENNGSGIVLTDAYARINNNYFHGNTEFGISCYASSPVLYCNNFKNDLAGELLLTNGSIPVLWEDKDQKGGANRFLNDAQTLVILIDSDILLQEGKNNFFVGPDAYFMADQSGNPTMPHKLDGNYWNPDIDLSLFNPPDPQIWAWGNVAELGECGEMMGILQGNAALLFQQAYDAEMEGRNLDAEPLYKQVITQYHATEWAPQAATRLFKNQLTIGTGFEELRLFYEYVITTFPDDEALVEIAKDLATQLWVENHQYIPAISTYQQILSAPPTAMDSVYAAIDYAITTFRQQNEDTVSGSLDCAVATVSAADISTLLNRVNAVRPVLPKTAHAGYTLPPTEFVLDAVYPNPFNPATTIGYYLPINTAVRIEVFNVMGQMVSTLMDGPATAGSHRVTWNATNFASGLYLCKMEAGGKVLTQKMLLMK